MLPEIIAHFLKKKILSNASLFGFRFKSSTRFCEFGLVLYEFVLHRISSPVFVIDNALNLPRSVIGRFNNTHHP